MIFFMDCPWNSPGKNTGVGSHSLLQGIFSTQGLKLCLLCFLHWTLKWKFSTTEPPGKSKLAPTAFITIYSTKNILGLCFSLYVTYTHSLFVCYFPLYIHFVSPLSERRGKKSITAYFIQFLKTVII